MKLNTIIINGYKSIKNTQKIIIDENVTVLIGANDHGKTNILNAIECLNDEKPINDIDKNWDKTDDKVEIEWHFGGDDVLEKLKPFLPATPAPAAPAPATPAPAAPAPATPAPAAPAPATPAPAAPAPVKFFPVNKSKEIIFYKNNLQNTLEIKSLPIEISIERKNDILKLRPRVELFDALSNNVMDEIDLPKLNDPKYEFMQGIFRVAGLWDNKDIIFQQNSRTSRLLDLASKKLTEELRDKWNQGKDLNWRLKHANQGNVINIEIEDPAIKNQYTKASLRSSGFRTFFLLTMLTYARAQNKPNDYSIFLFDEPGTYLHPRAQIDLQRSFEAISEKAQIIYSTHSIFLISKNHPKRNKVISKTINGTEIDQKPFIKNWKSVRESLGVLLSDNFLIADKTLLVEGPSDIVYILSAIKNLKAKGEIDVDLNDLSMVDAGNSDYYTSIAKIMLSEGRNVVALFDGDDAGKKIKFDLEKTCKKEIDENKLILQPLSQNKSSEDIFADDNLIRKSIKDNFDYLKKNNLRELAKIEVDEEIKKIKKTEGITLGKTIDDITSTFFNPKEKISKLSIALKYEENPELENIKLPEEAKKEIKKIIESLSIKGEKAVEQGVFEEIS